MPYWNTFFSTPAGIYRRWLFGPKPKAEAEGAKPSAFGRRPKPKVSKWGFFPIAQKSCGVSIYSEMHDILCQRAFRVQKLCFLKLQLIHITQYHNSRRNLTNCPIYYKNTYSDWWRLKVIKNAQKPLLNA